MLLVEDPKTLCFLYRTCEPLYCHLEEPVALRLTRGLYMAATVFRDVVQWLFAMFLLGVDELRVMFVSHGRFRVGTCGDLGRTKAYRTVSNETLPVITRFIAINIKTEKTAKYYECMKDNRNIINLEMEVKHWTNPA